MSGVTIAIGGLTDPEAPLVLSQTCDLCNWVHVRTYAAADRPDDAQVVADAEGDAALMLAHLRAVHGLKSVRP